MPAATPDDPQYVPRNTVNVSYRPKNYLMSPGLQRARAPYRLRNTLTGLALAAFGVGVWAYSIRAVKQDVFDDVDEEARALAGSGAAAGMRSIEDEQRAAAVVAVAAVEPARPAVVNSEPPAVRGVLVKLLDAKYPGLFDPARKTLVWGAPPVDSVGRTAGPSSTT